LQGEPLANEAHGVDGDGRRQNAGKERMQGAAIIRPIPTSAVVLVRAALMVVGLRAGMIQMGMIHEGMIHEGVIHEGMIHEGVIHEGMISVAMVGLRRRHRRSSMRVRQRRRDDAGKLGDHEGHRQCTNKTAHRSQQRHWRPEFLFSLA
jgi:hypothetical protein